MNVRTLLVTGFCILLTGCAYFSRSTDDSVESEYPAPDSEIQQILNSYRDSLEEVMGRKIATVKDTLRFKKPEGALSNLVADALRFRAASELRDFVHIGVIGDSSFKLIFEPGELTVGDVYEFIPYDHHLVVLTLEGSDLIELIDQVAKIGGAPISGIRFRINNNGNPESILVNAEVINPHGKYLVATSSWVANGGDQFPALWDADSRMDLNVSLQDLYVDYFRNQVELYENIDGRIRR